jgi:hypothetical protein
MGPYAKSNYLTEETIAFFPEYICIFLDKFYQDGIPVLFSDIVSLDLGTGWAGNPNANDFDYRTSAAGNR